MMKELCLLSLIFLSSCQKQKQHIKKEIKNNASSSTQELEAYFFDIPFLLNVYDITSSDNAIQLKVKATLEDVVVFYQSQLEMLGWDMIEQFSTASKRVLIYKKPAKKLCVLAEQHLSVIHVQLFLR